ncbi:hypothetical protein HDV05_008563 [Chytridiales sp. JEL 0842]|nr:hypothetical protein HDV05_008563 [Chytridiales sp. JEL 0842]
MTQTDPSQPSTSSIDELSTAKAAYSASFDADPATPPFDRSSADFMSGILEWFRNTAMNSDNVTEADVVELRKTIESAKLKLKAAEAQVRQLAGIEMTREEQEKELERLMVVLDKRREQVERYRNLPVLSNLRKLDQETNLNIKSEDAMDMS